MSAPRRLGTVLGAIGLLALTGCSTATSSPSPDTRTAGARPSANTSPSPSASSPSATPSFSALPTRTPSASAPAASPSVAPSDPPGEPVATEVARDLTSPWGLVALEDGSFLVSERDTRKIVRIADGRRTDLATIDDAQPQGEGGLLGLVLTPDRTRLLAYYTGAEDNRIVSMSFDGSRLGEPEPILTGIPKGLRHNGGRMLVGPDNLLYVGTGEIGEEELAQDRDNLGGKILRVTLDGVPARGNPFGNEVWSYGHRNVQGLAFDDEGRLWASEFGDQTWDELNLITRGGNYGWPEAEGSADIEDRVNPAVVWRTEEASPSGLVFWQGDLWMAGLAGERLWQIPVEGTKAGDPVSHFRGDYGRLRSLVVAIDGNALLLTASNTDGRNDPVAGDDRLLEITR